MKKRLICIIIVLIVIISVFVYMKLTKNNNDVQMNTNNVSVNGTVVEISEKFLLYIDDITQDNSNVKVTGIVSKGNINVNDEISIVGLGKKGIDSKIVKLEIDGKEKDLAKKGDKVSITLDSNANIEYITKGQAVIALGTTKPIYNIDAVISSSDFNISDIKEKGNVFYINTDIKCSISIISEEKKEIKISLDVPIVIENGIEFIIKNDDIVIANCTVINE